MKTDNNTNGNYKKIKLEAGQCVMIDAEEVHRVDFKNDAVIVAVLLPPVDKELPEQGQESLYGGFKLTGIYSDKDIKVIKAEGGERFPPHNHPGKELLHVIKGQVGGYYYRILAVGLLWMVFNKIGEIVF